ncbi:hypothetical protein GCM10010171_19940 [Actinokineospora fastidiosa]|uniref:Uncharacterized protein n=2 Tax=Actinokineospora fastidiosa TaxID=1816 RepID=A0A918GAV3_9PSEU|nr:hypothetical protein GCM10010171_19940 [Actinokineospora fastidiosa]
MHVRHPASTDDPVESVAPVEQFAHDRLPMLLVPTYHPEERGKRLPERVSRNRSRACANPNGGIWVGRSTVNRGGTMSLEDDDIRSGHLGAGGPGTADHGATGNPGGHDGGADGTADGGTGGDGGADGGADSGAGGVADHGAGGSPATQDGGADGSAGRDSLQDGGADGGADGAADSEGREGLGGYGASGGGGSLGGGGYNPRADH